MPLSLWVLLWFGGLALSVGAWGRYGRSDIPLGLLLRTPFYILWKIPLYFAFLFNRQSQWVRTEREKNGANPPG